MKKKFCISIALIICCIIDLVGDQDYLSKYPTQTKSYITLSVPKAGSHLIAKVFAMISSNPGRAIIKMAAFHRDEFYFPPHRYANMRRFDQLRPKAELDGLFAHFNFGRMVWDYSKQNPDAAKIINIRDLRDVCVSTVFFMPTFFDQWLGSDASIEKRLLYLINSERNIRGTVFDVALEAKEAILWMKSPDVVVCRFENLVGSKGGGSDVAQHKEIAKIATALGVNLTADELTYIGEQLFGGSATFRSGTIGKWKKHFTPKVKKAFKKRLGRQLIEMGYEKNNSW